MYTDDEERTGLPLKTFLITILLIIIFILLLVWLLPMRNGNNNNNYNNNNNNYDNSQELKLLEGLANRIFNSNIQEMKYAGIFYFTKDKLPTTDGASVTLTLQQMLDKKLLLPFKDKYGNSCDTTNSYIKLTRINKDEYEMKTNLKCGDEENYTVTTLGCYAYCTSGICEKNTTTTTTTPTKPTPTPTPTPVTTGPSCSLTVSSGTVGTNGWYNSNVVVKFNSKYGGTNTSVTSYGLTNTNSAIYNKNDSYTITANGITTIYGYVKNSNGKTAVCSITVKKDAELPSCNLSVLSGTKGANGSYVSDVVVGFSSKNDTVSGLATYGVTTSQTATYNGTTSYKVTNNGTTKIYGYVKDNAGNVSKCETTITKQSQNPTPVVSNPSCTLKVTSGTKGTNDWYTGNAIVEFATKSSTNGATITSFGLGTTENYNNNKTFTVSNDGTNTVYGYVKDSNGKTAKCSLTIKKDATKPSCSLKVTSGTLNKGGYYTSDIKVGFTTKTDATSGLNSYGIVESKTPTYNSGTAYLVKSVGTHVVYGYVKDNAGNTNVCSLTVEKRDNLEYQYKKHIDNQYSAWSEWTTLTYDPKNKPSFGHYALIEIEDLGKVQEVDYYKETPGEAHYQYKTVKVGTATQTYCTGYNYYRDTKKTTTTYAIKETEKWKFDKLVTTTGYPTDTLSVKYVFVGYDWSDCGTGCTRAPKKKWEKWYRTVSVVTGTDTIVTSGVSVKCAQTATKTIEIFDTYKVFVDYEINRTPVYKDVYKYKKRTRTLTKAAYDDYKWSYYNDTSLTGQGYTMTGNTRVVG